MELKSLLLTLASQRHLTSLSYSSQHPLCYCMLTASDHVPPLLESFQVAPPAGENNINLDIQDLPQLEVKIWFILDHSFSAHFTPQLHLDFLPTTNMPLP